MTGRHTLGRRRRGFLAPGCAILALLGTWLYAQTLEYPTTTQVPTGDFAVRVEDYALVPLPSNLNGGLSRVSVMRFEPGLAPQFAARAFVADLKRYLYILDLNARTFTTYINFEEVFAKFVNGSSYGAGLTTFAFHPEYELNGKFYTVHTEGPTRPGSEVPSNEFLPGLDLTGGYLPTESIDPPEGTVARHAVLIEWTDSNLTNVVFEGTAREVLRVGFNNGNHSIADMLFSAAAQSGDPDYGTLYVALGDGGAGQEEEQDNSLPQRLDALPGKILRIIPDVDQRPTDLLAANGRYRIPTTGADPNPFIDLGAPDIKKEIFAYGFRNPQRMSWDAVSNTLIVADIGLYSWEEVNIVRKGANYGYSEREGPEQLLVGGVNDGKTGSQTEPPTSHPQPDTLIVAALSEPVPPRYPAAAYSHRDGDAIAGGFVYRGTMLPQLYGKYIFGDITTGRVFYVDLSELLAADDNDPSTLAPVQELQILFDHPDDIPDRGLVPVRLFDVVADQYARRGGVTGSGARLPQAGGHLSDALDAHGIPYGGGRADIRFAQDRHGELYILSKSDGMIRKLTASRSGATTTVLTSSPNPSELGEAVQLTANVTALAGTPEGSIEFFDGDQLLGTASLANGIATLGVSGLASGAHFLTARFVPVGSELLESIAGVTQNVGQADLVSSLSSVTSVAAPGTQVTFNETTSNIGTASAGASTTLYVLSVDAAYGGDLALGSRSVGSLVSGDASTGVLSLTVPNTTAPGDYYMIACADSTQTVTERDEQNNCDVFGMVTITRPDLTTTTLTASVTYVAPGGSFTVADTAHNQGGYASVPSTTRYYFSSDTFKSADDRLLSGSRAVTALPAGVSSWKSGTKVTVPVSTPLGFYVLLACADDTAKNVELSETNNCAATASQVQVGRADLVIDSVSNPPTEIAPGKTLSATAATSNRGTASSVSTTTRFYLSADALKDASDVLLVGAISVAALTPGATTSSTKTLTVPATTLTGTYRFLACADDTAKAIEFDETNNCTAAGTTVQVKQSDLIETAVSVPPPTIAAGGSFVVTDTVANIGAIASGSTTTRYYLSLDSVKNAGDVLLTGARSVASLLPGANTTGSRSVTVPTISTGVYYLLACADEGQTAVEASEANNCIASSSTTVVPPP